MDERDQLAITLYVPDRLLPVLKGRDPGPRSVVEGTLELDFIVPGWWEQAYTARLGAAAEGLPA